ncbi:MAG: hypothetical protein AAF416_17600 [Pseudomonadota bacterium]
MKALIYAATCASALVLAGSAGADEPFVLGDTSLDLVTAAGGVVSNTDITVDVLINKVVNIDINKDVLVNVDLNGDLADAEAAADASGYEFQLAETFVAAQVSPGLATSYSQAVAAGLTPLAPSPATGP